MRAIKQSASGGPRLVQDHPEPDIRDPRDAIVETTLTAAGTLDLLFSGDTVAVVPGRVLGHQAVGRVIAVGDAVESVRVGQRVLLSPIVGCGTCAYCSVGFFAQCVTVNPGDAGFGGSYLGGPDTSEAFDGVHSERVRVPYADSGLAPLPDGLNDELALLMTEMYPLGFFTAKLSLICAGDRVGVFGADPAGLMAAATSMMLGAGRVVVVDDDESRLANAARLGVTTVLSPPGVAPAAVRDLLGNRGVQCGIVTTGAGADVREPGRTAAVLTAAVDTLTRDSTLAVSAVLPPTFDHFPISSATRKYVTIKAAACNYTKYLGPLVALVGGGVLTDSVLTDVSALATEVAPEDLYMAAHDAPTRWAFTRWSDR